MPEIAVKVVGMLAALSAISAIAQTITSGAAGSP
jgi:hypothetical protein